MDVGIAPSYKASNHLFSLIKRIEGRISNDRYFQKLEDWEPEGGFYTRF